MRETKFRGKANEEWYYGDLIIANDTDGSKHYYIIANEYLDRDSGEFNTIELDTCNSPEVEQKTIGQYTGLKDKNGKEIYEGAIVKGIRRTNQYEEYEYFEIKFHNGCFMAGNFNMHEFFDKFSHKEVISNIHDNPEMLEVQNEH